VSLTLLFLVLGLLALGLVAYLANGRHSSKGSLDQLASRLRRVDVDAFLNLTDESEEQFLRQRLPAWEFRKILRERKLAAVEYVWGAAQNASILIQLAEAARQDPDPDVAAAGQKLLDSAVRLRLYAFMTVPQLYLGILFPQANVSRSVAESYGAIRRQVVMLGCLHYPTHDMSSAL
jgi:hypothetical protein